MKKLLSIVLVITFILYLVGCSGKTYELPHDQFCYLVDKSQVIELNVSDKEHIVDILNNASWINDITNCGCDYVFYTQKQEVRYHSECGTFIDITNKKSTTVSDGERSVINTALGIG